jgi:hypothetical protein
MMIDQTKFLEKSIELAEIPGTALKISRVALGTWAIGGWMWGGTDEAESVSTIHAALDHGINVIDTAPVYGFGRSEEIVGKAITDGRLRSRVLIATKAGLEWRDGKIFRNASRERIQFEIEESLRRLQTDHIDIYQIHWPDPLTPIEETADAMQTLYRQGKIRAIGVSNFSVSQMEQFHSSAPLHPTIFSNAESRRRFYPFAAKTELRLSVTAHYAGDFYPDECGRTLFSTAMTCAARTRNSKSPDLVNISPPCNGSIVSPRNVSINASFTWRSAGCSIKA